ncbi:RipA family octameric membrane protein [Micromonospora vinacea]|uniref:RipA family octameric membrane protein n=1 Tax=Micromonospora vinacea TaxID=709878 RepID=UPI003D8D01C0
MDEQAAPAPRLSFDEFRMYYESAERVTNRRLDINKWNYSIMAATLLAVGAILTWAISRPANMLVGTIGVLMISTMALLHCTYWILQIDDFKALNAEKFRILNEMAPNIDFPIGMSSGPVASYQPFEREWHALERKKALAEISRSGLHDLVALKSSSAEYFIPKAFRVLFALIIIGTLTLGIMSHKQIIERVSPFDGVAEEAQEK